MILSLLGVHLMFKCNLLIYKAMHLNKTPYISTLIKCSHPRSGKCFLVSSTRPSEYMGLDTFQVVAHTGWNSFPGAIRTQDCVTEFISLFRTYLLKVTYPPPQFSPLSDTYMTKNGFWPSCYLFLDIPILQDVCIYE